MTDSIRISVHSIAGEELLCSCFAESALVEELLAVAASQAGAAPQWSRVLQAGVELEPASTLHDSGLTAGASLTLVVCTRPRWASSTGRLLRVALAGSACANGLYYPVETLPLGAGPEIGPRKWRHRDRDWLHIFRQDSLWWIGHFADCTHDFYCSASGDEQAPPCRRPVWDALHEEPHQQGALPPPWVDWVSDEPAPPRIVRERTGSIGPTQAATRLQVLLFDAVQLGLQMPEWIHFYGPRGSLRPEEHLEHLEALFDEWNVSGTGFLSSEEVRDGLDVFGIPKEVAYAAFHSADADHDEMLSRVEFENWILRRLDIEDAMDESDEEGGALRG